MCLYELLRAGTKLHCRSTRLKGLLAFTPPLERSWVKRACLAERFISPCVLLQSDLVHCAAKQYGYLRFLGPIVSRRAILDDGCYFEVCVLRFLIMVYCRSDSSAELTNCPGKVKHLCCVIESAFRCVLSIRQTLQQSTSQGQREYKVL